MKEDVEFSDVLESTNYEEIISEMIQDLGPSGVLSSVFSEFTSSQVDEFVGAVLKSDIDFSLARYSKARGLTMNERECFDKLATLIKEKGAEQVLTQLSTLTQDHVLHPAN